MQVLLENNSALPFKDELFNIFNDPAITIIFRNSCPHSSEGKYKDVHSSSAFDHKNLQTTQMTIARKMNKLFAIYL